jgi:hypothetical protein
MASAEEKVLSPSYIGDGMATTKAIRRGFSGLICQAAMSLVLKSGSIALKAHSKRQEERQKEAFQAFLFD